MGHVQHVSLLLGEQEAVRAVVVVLGLSVCIPADGGGV
jgi:hypothetical protein